MALLLKYLHKAPFTIDAFGLTLPVQAEEHINKSPFRGILTRLDEPSTRPPNGAEGHKVIVPRAVAEQALSSLVGMPIDFSDELKDHDKKQIVGVIEYGTIEGSDLLVTGYLLEKNWPEEVAEIRRRRHELGMSYEISDVDIVDTANPIWTLSHFVFTGAAILRKDAAAYAKTAIAATAEEVLMPDTASAIMTKLATMQKQLLSLEAATQDEDDLAAAAHEAEAASHDEAAARHAASATQAAADADTQDAATSQEAAKASRAAASVARLAAAKCHEDAAMKLRAASYDDDTMRAAGEANATRHDAEAARLKAADVKQQDAAAQEAADTQDAAKPKDDWDTDMMGMLLRGMMQQMSARQDLSGAKKPSDDDAMVKMLGTFMRAMTYAPTMSAKAVHDDKDADVALMRQFLRRAADTELQAAQRQPVASIEERRRLRRIEAATELLTDQVSKLTGLITDMVHAQRNLSTDASNGSNGGAAQRKTLHATNESWVSKDGVTTTQKTANGKMTSTEMDAALDEMGITDPAARIAKKFDLQMAGKLA